MTISFKDKQKLLRSEEKLIYCNYLFNLIQAEAKKFNIKETFSKIFPKEIFGYSILYELTDDLYANLRFITERMYLLQNPKLIDLLDDKDKYLFDVIHLSADKFLHVYFEKGLLVPPREIFVGCRVEFKCEKNHKFHKNLWGKKIRVVFWALTENKIKMEPLKTHMRLMNKLFFETFKKSFKP